MQSREKDNSNMIQLKVTPIKRVAMLQYGTFLQLGI
jgi:hypothetical protein